MVILKIYDIGHHVDVENESDIDITKKVRFWMSVGLTLLVN